MTEADLLSNKTEMINGLQVRRAEPSDLDATWRIIKSCSDWLKGQGMNHWDRYYTKELVEKKLKTQEVYLAFSQDSLVGTITLDTNPVSYYEEKDMASFANPEAQALYVTALAVLPESQGKGIASKLMEFAETQAKKREIGFIRFDCRASYTDLINFYTKRGYQRTGDIIDEEDNNEVYYLMEKQI